MIKPAKAFLGLAFLLTSGPLSLSARGGDEAYEKGDYAAAAEDFRAQASDSKDAGPAYNLGNALYRQGRFEEAENAYQESLQKNPRLEDGWYNLGNAMFRQDRFRDSILAYQGALSLDPDDQDALHNLGLAKRILEKDPKRDKSRNTPGNRMTPAPTATPPPQKGDRGDEDKKGKNPDPSGKESKEGVRGGSAQQGTGQPDRQKRRDRQEQARRDLGMSDEQVQKTLDNLSREEQRLQPYFSRNPRRDFKKRNDPLNMMPKEQQELMRRFFGSGALGRKTEKDEPEKDW